MSRQCLNCASAVTSILMLLALALSTPGTFGKWWAFEPQNGVVGFDFNAWTLNAGHAGGTIEKKWDDVCKTLRAPHDQWCVRLKVTRAFTILTVIFAFVSLFTVFIGWYNESRSWVSCGSCLIFMTWLFSDVAAGMVISVAHKFMEETASGGKPGYAFFLLCAASSFSCIGMVLACCGSKKGGFEQLVNGKPQQGQYGGWGAWRPRRGSFRSAAGLSNPAQGATPDATPPTSPSSGFPPSSELSPIAACGAPPPQHVPYSQYQPQTIYGQHMPPPSGMPQAPPTRGGDFGV